MFLLKFSYLHDWIVVCVFPSSDKIKHKNTSYSHCCHGSSMALPFTTIRSFKLPNIVFKTLLQIAARMPSSTNYRSWLRVGSISKGHDSTSLDLKAIAKCGDPRPMARWTKSFIPVTMCSMPAWSTWSIDFGFAMMAWSILWVATKMNMLWTRL